MKIKRKRILLLMSMMLLSILLLTGCVRKSMLEGKWYAVSNDKYYSLKFDKKSAVEFFADGEKSVGKYKIKRNAVEVKTGKSFKGTVNGDKINVVYEGKNLKFSKSTQVNVTFNTKGGTSISNKKIDIATTIEINENPKKKGYIFKGWYLDQKYKTAFKPKERILKDITLFAKWVKKSGSASSESEEKTAVSKITYTQDEFATTVSKGQELRDGEGYKLELPTMNSEYEFLGWYTEDHKTQLTGSDGLSIEVWDSQNGDINVVPHYKSVLNLKYERIVDDTYMVYQDEEFNVSEVKIPKFYDGGVVTKVGRFSNAKNLEKIIIGEKVKEIEENPAGCSTKFKEYDVDVNNGFYKSIDGVLYSKDLSIMYSYPIAKEGDSFVVESATTEIAPRAFKDSFIGTKMDAESVGKHLKKVEMTQNISKIGEEAFLNRVGLENVTFTPVSSPAQLKLGARSFMYTSLKEYAIPSNTVSIGPGAFESDLQMRNLINVKQEILELPEGLVQIGEKAFSFNNYLSEVKLSKSLEQIGAYAFANCPRLSKFDANENELIETIPQGMLSKAQDITDISLPKRITTIEAEAFIALKKVEEITLPNTVTKIGDKAFSGMEKLKRINIPSSVVDFGKGVFINTESLNFAGIQIEPNSRVLVLESDALYNSDKTELIKYNNLSTQEEYIMPDSITYLGEAFFKNNNRIKKVKLSKNLKYIGEQAFHSSTITEVIIPSSVEEIGQKAFYGTKKLKKITFEAGSKLRELHANMFDSSAIEELTLPEGLEAADAKAIFRDMTSLKTLNIPSTIKRLEIGAMLSKTAINTINVALGNAYFVVENGILYTSDKKSLVYVTKSFNNETLDISGVEQIRQYAFYNNKVVKKITGTSNLTTISEGAFQKTTIESIDLSSVVEIQKAAFKMSSIKSANLINVETLGEQVFSRCSKLSELILGSKLENIDRATFEKTAIKTLVIPNSVKKIGEMAFEKNTDLESLIIGDGIQDLDACLRGFNGCTKLKEITFGLGTKNLTNTALESFSNLEIIKLGEGIERIDARAFDSKSKLKSIQVETEKQLNKIIEIPYMNTDTSVKKAIIRVKKTLNQDDIQLFCSKQSDDGEYSEYKFN